MAFTSHINVKGLKPGSTGGGSSGTSATAYGRVVHVVLSDTDKYCNDLQMVNGVFYRDISISSDEGDIANQPFAYAGNTTIRTMPLVGEIVELQNLAGSTSLGSPQQTTKYWTKVVNIWNHPHHNAAPDTLQENWKGNLLGDFEEQSNINPLLSNQGDTIIEGRLSQTIRIGGAKGPAGTIIDTSQTQSPIILISNGQATTSGGNQLIQEDINKDFNSIYLLSNHKVPLIEANSKRDSYNQLPIAVNQFTGNQVVVNAGRLIFNAKQDSVLILAKQSVGLAGATINLDANEYFCVDSNSIFLGKGARTASRSVRQPAVLGGQLENWLETLLIALDSIAQAMQTASAIGAGPVTQLNAAGPVLKATIQTLRTQYQGFKSKKVYIE